MVIMTTATPPTSGRLLIQHQQERRNNDVIRMRLLNNLGIQRKETNLLLSSRASIEGSSKRRKSSTAQPNQQSNNNSNADYSVPFSTRLTLPFDKKPRIQFAETVQVRKIPHHQEYSENDRHCLWSGLQEIQANAERNDFELFADGDHWEIVVDRNDVIVKSVVALSIA
jgi:hypothetical protein